MPFNREAYEQHYRQTGKTRGLKVTTWCIRCGTTITDYASQTPRRYCSRECKREGSKDSLEVACSHCGRPVQVSPSRLKWSNIRGRGRIYCDRECQRLGNAEERHPMWIEDRTKIKQPRSTRTLQYKRWRRAVFERDKHTCQKCGRVGGHLHAHHIKEWEYYPELRYEVSNGLTLCRTPCHRDMHKARRSNRKVADDQIPVIKEMRKNGATLAQIAKIFGVSYATISVICAGKKRKHQLP